MFWIWKDKRRVMGPFESKSTALHVARKMIGVAIQMGKNEKWRVKEDSGEDSTN